MISKARGFLLGMLLAAAGAAIAVDTGGFPSQPTFQTIKTTGAALFSGGVVRSNGTTGAVTYRLQNNGTDKAFFCVSVTAGSCTVGDSVNDVTLDTAGGALYLGVNSGSSTALKIDTSGNITAPGAASVPWCNTGGGSGNCPAKGVQVAGVFSCTSGGCSTTHGTGVSGTPTRNSTGNYTVTFSPTFSSTPSCIAMLNSTTGIAIGLTPGTSSMTFETFNTSGTSIDAAFSILCSN